jgi:hypothetical protein
MQGSDLLALTTDPNSSATHIDLKVLSQWLADRLVIVHSTRSAALLRIVGAAAHRRRASYPPRAQPQRPSAREASDQSRRSAARKSAAGAESGGVIVGEPSLSVDVLLLSVPSQLNGDTLGGR